MWIEWLIVGFIFGAGFGVAFGFFIGSVVRIAKRFDCIGQLASPRLTDKQGQNDLSRWKQFGGTLERPAAPPPSLRPAS